MPVAVVHIVDVVPMRHRRVAAAVTMTVVMAEVFDVAAGLALVPVSVVLAVQVTVVGVVEVVFVLDPRMPALGAVAVGMPGVLVMGGCRHDASPGGCLVGTLVPVAISRDTAGMIQRPCG